MSETESQNNLKKNVQQAVAVTAKELANTKAVCRTNYIHLGLLKEAESGKLQRLLKGLPTKSKAELNLAETRTLAILPRLDFT